eukprot:TRINITY_DN50522_c0_g1_i1.p1 TRINITY_DN50522_c0_g1~~TRINITY_DN50522_c0_g1_i1.p1  ORF type:complete len:844 (+),score=141.28 TRINITY_DN50522_c0_g1_i1:228-2759(+)
MRASQSHVALVPIRVVIPSADLERNLLQQQHALYVVYVQAFGMSSEVRRTFEEFEALHTILGRKIAVPLPLLPPSCWSWHESPELVEERRVALQSLLQMLLNIPEVIDDGEENFLRFLNLPKAAAVSTRFVCASATTKGSWLQSLYETTAQADSFAPLHDQSVENGLLEVLEKSLDEAGRVASTARLTDVTIVCELLSRLFRSGCGSSCSVVVSDAVVTRRDTTRAPVARSLLAFVCCGQEVTFAPTSETHVDAAQLDVVLCSESLGRLVEVSRAADKALLTLARGGRASWSRTLFALLSDDGAQRLAEVANLRKAPRSKSDEVGSTSESTSLKKGAVGPNGARLVAELLLRGFDPFVAERLAEQNLIGQRRRILNALFESTDAFVKVAVGFLLAQLVRVENFGEAGKAHAGLQVLCHDMAVRSAEFRDESIVRLLLEEENWAWLCRLVSATQPWVSGFALLVIVLLVQPDTALVMGTDGFFQVLQSLVHPGVDPLVRGYAARLLIATGQGEPVQLAAAAAVTGTVELGHAVGACIEMRLAADASEHATMTDALVDGRHMFDTAGSLEPLLADFRARAENLSVEATAWAESLSSAKDSLGKSEEARNVAQDDFQTQRVRLSEVEAAAAADFNYVELRNLEASVAMHADELAAGERSLAETLEARVRLTEKMTEYEEVQARRGTAAHFIGDVPGVRLNNSSEAPAAPSVECVPRCQPKHATATQTVEAFQHEAQQLDERLRAISEPLPQMRTVLSSERFRVQQLVARRAPALNVWAQAFDAQDGCSRRLQLANASLRSTGCIAGAERSHRRQLRGAVQVLVASLQALDGQLESLEANNSFSVAS